MTLKMTDIKEGDWVFIGSRWHKILTVQRKGETYKQPNYHRYGSFNTPETTTKTYEKDFIRIACTYGDYFEDWNSKGEAVHREIPKEGFVQPEDKAFPKCRFCTGDAYDYSNRNYKPRGNFILMSEIMDIPAVRERVEKKLTRQGYNTTWKVEPRFRIVDDRDKE